MIPGIRRLADDGDGTLRDIEVSEPSGHDGPISEAQRRLEDAEELAELFALAKELVRDELGSSRVGIMVGLQGLGLSPNGYLGGYYVAGSNAIVLNRDVLAHVEANHPRYWNAYAFHVLLHEYLHSLGYFDEEQVRRKVLAVCRATLGPDHAATRIAATMAPGAEAHQAPELFRQLTLPPYGWEPDQGGAIEYVSGIDRDTADYIA